MLVIHVIAHQISHITSETWIWRQRNWKWRLLPKLTILL